MQPTCIVPALIVAVLAARAPATAQCSQQPVIHNIVHAHGQTFLTWDELPSCPDVTYKVYRSRVPITSLTGLPFTLLPQDSGEFYADRIHQDPTPPNCSYPFRYVERLHVPDGSGGVEEVSSGRGVLVWTVNSGDLGGGLHGMGYYAVTTVDPLGIENLNLGTQNTTSILEHVRPLAPIEVTNFVAANPPTFTDCAGGASQPPPGVHVYIQYMDLHDWNPTFDAPNALNCWWGEDPAATRIRKAIQYAYTYTVSEPHPDYGNDPNLQLPVILKLHQKTNLRWKQSYCTPGMDYADANAFLVVPVDAMDTWWFGFADKTFDYRKIHGGAGGYRCSDGCGPALSLGGTPLEVPHAPAKIVNFTEARVLRMLDDLQNDPVLGARVDPERWYVLGHSMGGSGALSMAMRFPDVFAAADASKPMTSYREYVKQIRGVAPYPAPPCPAGDELLADYADDLELRWGAYASNLTVEIRGPAQWITHLGPYSGVTGVWDWQDHELQARTHPEARRVPLGMVNGQRDRTIPYASQGAYSYGAFIGSAQCWAGLLNCGDHGNAQFQGQSRGISAPMVGRSFYGYKVKRSESVPGFGPGSSAPTIPGASCPPCSTVCTSPPSCSVASYWQNIRWASSWLGASPNGFPLQPPTETSAQWSIDFFTTDGSTLTVDVAPRRLKGPAQGGFDLAAATTWTNYDMSTGVPVQVQPTGTPVTINGVVTMQGVQIGPLGNRLVVQ